MNRCSHKLKGKVLSSSSSIFRQGSWFREGGRHTQDCTVGSDQGGLRAQA